MSRSVAQKATVTLAVEQTITISNPVESKSMAQPAEVTLGTDYIYVECNPATKLPQE